MKREIIFIVFGVLLASFSIPEAVSWSAAAGDCRSIQSTQVTLFLIGEQPGPDAESKGLEDIERQVKELLQELEKLQREATRKFRTEVAPQLQKQIEKLKEWLRDFRLEKKKEPQVRQT